MRITLLNLYNGLAQSTIERLADEKLSDITLARMIIRLVKATKANAEEFQKVVDIVNNREDIKVILQAVADEKNKDNQPLINSLNMQINSIISEELSNATIELDIEPISFDVWYAAGVSPREMLALEWLIKD